MSLLSDVAQFFFVFFFCHLTAALVVSQEPEKLEADAQNPEEIQNFDEQVKLCQTMSNIVILCQTMGGEYGE